MNLKPEILQKILDSGESVEWAGRPEPFKAIDSHNRMSVIIRSIVTIVIAALLIVGYFVMVKKTESPVSPWAPLIILAFAIFLLCRPFTDARTLTKKRSLSSPTETPFPIYPRATSKKCRCQILTLPSSLIRGTGSETSFLVQTPSNVPTVRSI